MKLFKITEFYYKETLDECIIFSASIEEAVEVYINTRKEEHYKQHEKELFIEINENPNENGVYQGHAYKKYEDEDGNTRIYEEFEICLYEINILPNELVGI